MTLLKPAEAEAYLNRPDPARPIALVFGPDAGLVSERVEALVRASVDDVRDAFAVSRLSGDEVAADPARLIDEAQSIPMFGGRRAISIRTGTRNFTAAIEALAAVALRDCQVVIEAGDLKRSAPLRALCERARNIAAIACYADAARDVERLIDEEMRAAGLPIGADARAALVPLLGGDRRLSRSELRKLALYAYGRDRVSVDDVLAVIGDASLLALDQVIDAAFARQPRELETQFARALGAGTAPGTIIAAAQRQVSQLHKMRLALDAGASLGDAMGPQVFFRRKEAWEKSLRAWSAADLARAMAALAAAALEVRRQPALADSHARQVLLQLAAVRRAH